MEHQHSVRIALVLKEPVNGIKEFSIEVYQYFICKNFIQLYPSKARDRKLLLEIGFNVDYPSSKLAKELMKDYTETMLSLSDDWIKVEDAVWNSTIDEPQYYNPKWYWKDNS